MKGPGVRLDLDVRRVWQCPRCSRTIKTDGNLVAKRCTCTPEGVWMRLVRDGRPARPGLGCETASAPPGAAPPNDAEIETRSSQKTPPAA